MDRHELLNEIYRPLYETGLALRRTVTELGYDAKLGWFNLHETQTASGYQTEFFPMPVVEIAGMGAEADLGVSLNGSCWLELTLNREKALLLDYAALGEEFQLAVYSANDYLGDLYHPGDSAQEVRAGIAASGEREIHLCFSLADCESASVRTLLTLLRKHGIVK